MSVQIVPMTLKNMADLPNRDYPYTVIGRMHLYLADGRWSYEPELYDIPMEKTFPEEEIDREAYVADPHQAAFLAYDGQRRVGSVLLKCDWNLYGFINDIGVESECRGKGVGRMLLEQAERWAREQGMLGLALEAQDVNLNAARFYEACGFEIGGVNTKLYENFGGPQEYAVFWYKSFQM